MYNKREMSIWEILTPEGKVICVIHSSVKPEVKPRGHESAFKVAYRMTDPNGKVLVDDITQSMFVGNGPMRECVERLDEVIQKYGLEKTIEFLKVDEL